MGGDLVEWRLGYLPQSEVDRAYGDATLAVFPYRPGLDQSGTLLRALGAGVPAVAYDVGGLGENVRRFGAGRVVPAGDVDAMADAVRELLDDPAALERAREGALRARETLTWETSARMHVDLYEELLARVTPRPSGSLARADQAHETAGYLAVAWVPVPWLRGQRGVPRRRQRRRPAGRRGAGVRARRTTSIRS